MVAMVLVSVLRGAPEGRGAHCPRLNNPHGAHSSAILHLPMHCLTFLKKKQKKRNKTKQNQNVEQDDFRWHVGLVLNLLARITSESQLFLNFFHPSNYIKKKVST